MSGDEKKLAAIRYYWGLALECLESAEREFLAGANHFAINRAYYSLFYAVSAALLEKNRMFVKHSGVKSAFHEEFIKTGLLDKKWSKVYNRLFEDRQQGDYAAFVIFDSDIVKEQIVQCKEFVHSIQRLITAINS